jgi:hypothetical protein
MKNKIIDAGSAITFGLITMSPIELWVIDLPVEGWIKIRLSSIPGNIIYGVLYGLISSIPIMVCWRQRSIKSKIWTDTILAVVLGTLLYSILLYCSAASADQIQKGVLLSMIISVTTGGLYGWWQDTLRKLFVIKPKS